MGTFLNMPEAVSLGLHTMVFLNNHAYKNHSTKEIANAIQGSEHHLAKVINQLKKAGFVTTERGPQGGVKLTSNANKISLMDIYEALEGPFIKHNCFLGRKKCRGEKCVFSNLRESIFNSIRDYLKITKLRDLRINSV